MSEAQECYKPAQICIAIFDKRPLKAGNIHYMESGYSRLDTES